MGILDFFFPPWQGTSEPAARAAEPPALPGGGFVPSTVASIDRLLGATDRSATPEQIRTAYRGIVHVAARLRANAVAEAMLKARVVREVKPDEFEEVEPTHPWRVLLRRPCPSLPARVFWRWVQTNKDLSRGAFLWVERDGRGVPVALWPIYASFGEMRAAAGGLGQVERFILHRADGRRVEFDAADIVWLRHPHPLSPTESASLLMAAAYESDVDLAEKVYRRDAVRGSGAARLYVTTDQTLTKEQAEASEAIVTAKVFGSRTRVPVFGQGSDLKPLGLSAQDMEFIEGAKFNKTDLLQIFGVPEGLLSDQANRANADAARLTFADLTVQPEADDAADQLTADFAAAFRADGSLRVLAPEIVPLDPDYLLREAESALKTGRRTLNEQRRRDGVEEYGPWADVPLVSAALVPAESVAAQASPREPSTPPARGSRAARASDDDEAAWADIERRRATPLASVRNAAENVLGAMHRAVVAHLTDARAVRQDVPAGLRVDDVFDVTEWLAVLEEELGGPLILAINEGFKAGAFNASYDAHLDLQSDAVRDAIARVVERTSTVPDTVRDVLETALRDGLDAGDDVAALVRRIGGVFGELRTWEAERIALTASNSAFEAGQQQAFAEAGITRHRWLTQRDGAVRASHTRCDGVERAVGDAFPNGLRYPHDPDGPASEVVNCRCTVLPVLE